MQGELESFNLGSVVGLQPLVRLGLDQTLGSLQDQVAGLSFHFEFKQTIPFGIDLFAEERRRRFLLPPTFVFLRVTGSDIFPPSFGFGTGDSGPSSRNGIFL